ncbi:hypothetical protein Tco_1426361 [Tanacetum coccineum]
MLIWLSHLEIKDISTLGLRVYSTLTLILLILRRGWRGYTRDADGAQDAHGQSVLTTRAWRRLFDVRGPLVHELILEFFSTFRFGEAVLNFDTAWALKFQLGGVRHRMSQREFIMGMGLHTTEEMKSAGFGAYWAESARQIPDKGDLSAYWVGISSIGDFLGITPSYTLIKDLMLRPCHRLIAFSTAGRSQAPKKVTVTGLFYLRGMDVGSVNIPYLLTRYIRMFASGRKRGAMISGGQFVARLAKHFGLLTEFVRSLMILRLGVARLEEDVHGMRGALGEQRKVLDSMARYFSRFTTWTVTGLSRMMDHVGVRYSSYSDFQIPYVRRTRRRTNDASTIAARPLISLTITF